ncbi:hypothetical protein [Desulforamulus aeronauticus]|uniref:hypothetical protein n=1 Tax=Desulforamulus aeronauticus TaxID=53343 RepID=UPI0009324BEE|nr:hypothetical protein [Desulforamulus aeronauticus]
MITILGIFLLLLGLVGAFVMLLLAIRSMSASYPIQCKKCGHSLEIPTQPGEYCCPSCGVPLAKVEEK